ncbi:DUF6124 family protein [Pseudomonas sp. B21-056]|uniref:DUF6124 family protein n=1 Tax=Pseudomonas sp. B21-056 TaxID=2895495 RepID=UPI0039B6E9B2
MNQRSGLVARLLTWCTAPVTEAFSVSVLWQSCAGRLRTRRFSKSPVYQPAYGRHLRLVLGIQQLIELGSLLANRALDNI